jgi:hypothetical protein
MGWMDDSKQSTAKTPEEVTAAYQTWKQQQTNAGRPVTGGLPSTGFEAYDANKDGMISGSELAAITSSFDDGDNGSSGYPPRSLAEDLEYLRQEYGLKTEYELLLLREQARLNNDFEIDKMVKQFALSETQELKLLAEKYKYDLATELQVMKEKALLDKDAAQVRMDFEKLENSTDREWKTLEAENDRKWQTGEKEKDFEFQRTMATEDRDWKTEENAIGREFDLKLKGMDIASQQALQAARIAADQAMQHTELSFNERMQAANRAADKELAVLKITSDEKMQLKDLAMREALTKMEIASNEKMQKEKIASEEGMQQKGFEHDSAEKKADRELERQRIVAEMMGKDPVRAVLYSMGISGDVLGDQQFSDLGAMQGAEAYKAKTESALNAIEGTGGNTEINAQGVKGIAPIEKQARSFVQGSGAQQTLLSSAHGVGDSAAGGGISPEEVVQRALSVTPQGNLAKRAAYGAGEITPNTTYITGEGPSMTGTNPEAVVVDENRQLKGIVPLTNPNEAVQQPVVQQPVVYAQPPVNLFPKTKVPSVENVAAIPNAPVITDRTVAAPIKPVEKPNILPRVGGNFIPVRDKKTGKLRGWRHKDGREMLYTKNPETGESVSAMGEPRIDLASLGPQVIAKLMTISRDPRNPNSGLAKAKLMDILPKLRADQNSNRINRGALGLAGIM